MMTIRHALSSLALLAGLVGGFAAADIAPPPPPPPPVELGEVAGRMPVVEADGSITLYLSAGDEGSQVVARTRSFDGGRTWSEPETVLPLPADRKWAQTYPSPLRDREGNLHLFALDTKTKGMTTWHAMRPAGSDAWTPWQYVCPSGPQTVAVQLRSGRIVIPVGYFVYDRPSSDPRGRGEMATWYSDDVGKTWQKSPQTLMVPRALDFPGSRYGGWEPVIVERGDGRVWMAIRTQHGRMYESLSEDGVNWSSPVPTDFRAGDSPGALTRLPSGDIVFVWNGCEHPEPVAGKWQYTGRDALHAAISSDSGKTWRGFREVYRDPFRDATPPEKGDRGTSYPSIEAASDESVYIIAGQGEGRRRMIQLDPRWLRETKHADDFADGLDGWSVFKAYGPAGGMRRDRTVGPERIAHPATAGAWVLHVRRPDEKPGDGAAWNFPAGRVGKVTVRLLLREGFAGGRINLGDRFNYPDDADPRRAIYSLDIGADRKIGEATLDAERWYTLELAWDLGRPRASGGWAGEAAVSVDGERIATLPTLNPSAHGPSYLRLHSTAAGVDPRGYLVESVAAAVEP